MLIRIASLLAGLSIAGCTGPTTDPESTSVQANSRGFANVRILGADADPAPQDISTGRFVVVRDCLLFEVEDGARHNPVIAGSASVARDDAGAPRIILQGKPVRIGQRLRVVGGGSADIPQLTDAQKACAQSIFVMGQVLDD